MCLDERNTESRARPWAARLMPRRTFAVRRIVRSTTVAIARLPSLLLAFLAEDVLARILHALALVGLGLAERPDLGRHVPDLLVVDAADHNLGRLWHRDRDPLRDRIGDVVGIAELKLQVLALHRGAVADAGDLELALVALGDTLDALGHQRPVSPPHGAGAIGIDSGIDMHAVFLDLGRDVAVQDDLQGAL